jgi:hypothetical protein
MSRYRRLEIDGGTFFFYTLALADRGSDLLIRVGEYTRGHGAALVIGPATSGRTRWRLCPPYACWGVISFPTLQGA